MALGQYMTTEDVAKLLRVTPARIRQFVMEGRLEYEKKIGQVLFFDEDKVQEFRSIPRNPGRPKQDKKDA